MMNAWRLLLSVVMLSVVVSSTGYSADLYWVGKESGKWSDKANWAIISGQVDND
jgi:hypothetical protein